MKKEYSDSVSANFENFGEKLQMCPFLKTEMFVSIVLLVNRGICNGTYTWIKLYESVLQKRTRI